MLLTNAASILEMMLVAQLAPLSVSELLGNADRFHGQPVTVVGTEQFSGEPVAPRRSTIHFRSQRWGGETPRGRVCETAL